MLRSAAVVFRDRPSEDVLMPPPPDASDAAAFAERAALRRARAWTRVVFLANVVRTIVTIVHRARPTGSRSATCSRRWRGVIAIGMESNRDCNDLLRAFIDGIGAFLVVGPDENRGAGSSRCLARYVDLQERQLHA
jgi:hypothetical protein